MNYSKLSTPQSSKKLVESEPVKTFPLIRSNSKGHNSKENSPEISKILKSNTPLPLNSTDSPSFKQKKLFNLFEPAKVSTGNNYPKQILTKTGILDKNSEIGDDLKPNNSIKGFHDSKYNLNSSKSGRDYLPLTSKIENNQKKSVRNFEDSHYLLAQSAVQSRRTSKVLALPILGSHTIQTKPKIMSVSKKNGLAFASLNNSKVDIFREKPETTSVRTPDNIYPSKKDVGQGPLPNKNRNLRVLLDKMKEFLSWVDNRQGFLNLENIETTNSICGTLLAEAKELYLINKLNQPEDSKDTLDTSTPVNSYTKGTLNYLKLRNRKEEEANLVIIEALEDELNRLTSIKENLANPEYQEQVSKDINFHKNKIDKNFTSIAEVKKEVKILKEEVREKERSKVSQTEIAMHERDLKNTNLIRKFLTDDLKSISKKLEAASDQRESQQALVAEAERQAAVYGLDDTRTLQAFDSLSLALAGLKKDAEALELDLANRSKALEKKVNELRRITENKSRMVKTLTDEHRIIQEQILGIKKRESEKELSLINQIAIREKKKIALMTGDTRILSEDTLPLRETDFSNHETDARSNVKATHTPKTLETLNRT